METKMRRFYLVRNEDETGISGTGVVAEGVVFWDGTCVIKWTTDTSSMGIYKSHVEMIHLHGHEGRTYIKWVDEKKEEVVVEEDETPVKEKRKKEIVKDTEDVLEKVVKQLGEVSEKLSENLDKK